MSIGCNPVPVRLPMPLQASDVDDPALRPPPKKRRALLLLAILAGAPFGLVTAAIVLSLFKPFFVDLGWGAFSAGLHPTRHPLSLGLHPLDDPAHRGQYLVVPLGNSTWLAAAGRTKPGHEHRFQARFQE